MSSLVDVGYITKSSHCLSHRIVLPRREFGFGDINAWFDMKKNGLIFEESSGGCIVVGVENSNINTVRIPSEYNGIPVIGIGEGAFFDCSRLTSIEIPGTVTSIELCAFSGCVSLETVYYIGHKIDWDTVVIENDNDAIKNADVFCAMDDEADSWYDSVDALNIKKKEDEVRVERQYDGESDIERLQSAAKSGDAEAQFELGLCYRNGTGVDMDSAEAIKWFERAAKQGHGEAQGYLGDCYLFGEGVARDYSQAVAWYGKSAMQGNAKAQYTLGNCYRYGMGVPKNLAEAMKWYGMSAEQGNSDATKAWRKLGSHIEVRNGMAFPKGPSDGLMFETKTRSAIVSGFGDCIDADIVIPREYCGYPVTKIGRRAFSGSYKDETAIWSIDKKIGTWFCSYGPESVIVPNTVNSIATEAFAWQSTLEYVYIPESVKWLGSRAFIGSYNLKNVVLNGVMQELKEAVFELCKSLESVTIPDTVTSICSHAFDGCISLRNVGFGRYSQCSAIDSAAFYGCSSLKTFTFPSSVASLGSYSFYRCTALKSINIPDGVTSLGDHVFRDCVSLASIKIPEKVTSIDDGAFEGCTSLSSVDIPNGVVSVGNIAFRNCTSLVSLTFPDTLTSIGKEAFDGCASLVSVNIPHGVTSVNDHAFRKCTSLKSMTIPKTVVSIKKGAFEGCTSLKSVVVQGHMTELGSSAFASCTSLESVTMELGLDSIDMDAFSGCTALKSVTLGHDLRYIGGSSFKGCASLKTLVIPKNIETIWLSAFDGCSSLSAIYYCGSPSDWNKISIKALGGRSIDPSLIYYYSDTRGNCTGGQNFWHYVNYKIVVWKKEP